MRTFQGFKMPIPKYYKDRMFSDEKKIEVRSVLQKRMQKRIDDLIRKKKTSIPT